MAVVSPKVIYFESDNVVEVRNLTDIVADELIVGATVTAKIEDKDGNTIPNTSITLSDETNGLYRGIIPDTGAVNLTGDKCVYYLIVSADGGPGLKRVWKLLIKVEKGE